MHIETITARSDGGQGSRYPSMRAGGVRVCGWRPSVGRSVGRMHTDARRQGELEHGRRTQEREESCGREGRSKILGRVASQR